MEIQRANGTGGEKKNKKPKNVFLKSHLYHAWKRSHRVEGKQKVFVYVLR